MAAARQKEIKVSMTEVATTMRTRFGGEEPAWEIEDIQKIRDACAGGDESRSLRFGRGSVNRRRHVLLQHSCHVFNRGEHQDNGRTRQAHQEHGFQYPD